MNREELEDHLVGLSFAMADKIIEYFNEHKQENLFETFDQSYLIEFVAEEIQDKLEELLTEMSKDPTFYLDKEDIDKDKEDTDNKDKKEETKKDNKTVDSCTVSHYRDMYSWGYYPNTSTTNNNVVERELGKKRVYYLDK